MADILTKYLYCFIVCQLGKFISLPFVGALKLPDFLVAGRFRRTSILPLNTLFQIVEVELSF